MQYNRPSGQGQPNSGFGGPPGGPGGFAPPPGGPPGGQPTSFGGYPTNNPNPSYTPAAGGFTGPPGYQPPGNQPPSNPQSAAYTGYPPPNASGPNPSYSSQPFSPQGFSQSAPISAYGQTTPTAMGAPPMSGSQKFTSPTSAAAPPSMSSSGYAGPSAPVSTAPKPSVQFFSLSGGTPIPSSSTSISGAPPVSPASVGSPGGGFGGPPPVAGPPIAGPPVAGPPVSNMNDPNVGMFNPSMGSPQPGMGMAAGPGMGVPPPPDGNAFAHPVSSGAFEGGQTGAYAHNATLDNLMPSALPLVSEVDMTLKCRKEFLRPTIGKLVSSQSQANSSRVPIGMIISPMAGDEGVTNANVPLVDFGSTGIVRCKRCRTYINPFVVWMEGGRKWKCNICGLSNETPQSYFSHLDAQNRRRDRDQRPELYSCSVEFVAPNDYQIRPPQPPTYLFVIDVSSIAIANGMLASAVAAVKAVLGEIPGSPRTQIGFITFDSSIHFYSLKASLSGPQMLIVSDLSDIILPLPEDLIANLQDSKKIVETLLDSLPTMFANQAVPTAAPNVPVMSNCCTGSALAVAKHLLEPTGGKILLFQGSLPSLGEGTLKQRDNPRLLGSEKEHTLLNSEDQFYRNMALDYNKLQISTDVFLFSSGYTDVATLSVLPRYTGGTLYYYPAFNAVRDGISFQKDLEHTLSRATAFEAVMRVRATRGLRVTNFYGNYFIRGTDLLALPNCTSDSVFGIDLAFDEPVLQAQLVTIQAALLYTSSAGERRIRVHNLLLPVATSLPEMMESCDIDAIMNLLSKQAIEVATKAGLDNARNRVHQAAIDILKSLRSPQVAHGYGPGAGGPGQAMSQPGELLVPAALQLMPLYAMALQKNVILRGGNDIRSDERAYYHQRISNADVNSTRVFIYPRLFSIQDMSAEVGIPSDNPEDIEGVTTAGPLRIRLPNLLNLSAERLQSDGIYLLENSVELLMWIGRSVNPSLIALLFGFQSLDGVDMAQLSLQPESSDYASRLNAVIVALKSERTRRMQLHFIREGDGYAEAYFARFLVEDRANFQGGALSYSEYYGLVLRSV